MAEVRYDAVTFTHSGLKNLLDVYVGMSHTIRYVDLVLKRDQKMIKVWSHQHIVVGGVE